MHPPEETLLSVAAGEADVAHRALVEAHAASCAACREELAALSAPGGLLLCAVGETPPPAALWERLVARLPAPTAAAPSPLAGTPVPPAARAELPELDALAWRWPLVRGARIATLWADRATGTTLLIGHMPGGRPFPRHRHPGGEDVVVLAGAYAGRLRPLGKRRLRRLRPRLRPPTADRAAARVLDLDPLAAAGRTHRLARSGAEGARRDLAALAGELPVEADVAALATVANGTLQR